MRFFVGFYFLCRQMIIARFLTILLLWEVATLNAQLNPEVAKGLEKAKSNNSLLLIDFYTDWCYWCKVLEKETFSNDRFKERTKDKYTIVRLNAEKKSGIDMAKRYGISSYPTCLIMTADQKIVQTIGGYAKSDIYGKLLDSFWNLHKAGKYLAYSTKQTLNFPEFYEKMYNVNKKEIRWPNAQTIDSFIQRPEAWTTEEGIIVLSKVYARNKKYLPKCLQNYHWVYTQFGDKKADHILEMGLIPFIEDNLDISTTAMQDTLKKLFNLAAEGDTKIAAVIYDGYYPYFLTTAKRYSDYAVWIDENLKLHPEEWDNEGINNAAWTLYESCSDTAILNLALNWMKKVVDTDDEYNHADTYASLLFALHRYDEAETEALKAIELAKASKKDYSATQKLLNKIEVTR